MPKARQQQSHLFVTLAYLLVLTGLSLLPGKYLAVIGFPGGTWLYHFAAYGLFSWLMLASLGNCPLRWRSLYPWVLVMALTHAYWMEFLQAYLPSLQRQASLYDLLAGLAGAIAGVVLRLRFAYSQCNCSLMGGGGLPAESVLSGRPHETPYPLTIADHPGLHTVVAHCFGWKALTLKPAEGTSINMVCTGRSMVSLPHFSYGSMSSALTTAASLPDLLAHYALPRNIAQMEIRQAMPDSASLMPKTASWLPLCHTMEVQMKGFSPNLRHKISKGCRNGFAIRQGGAVLLHDFWLVYARHLDKLGSVALPERFFNGLLKGYGEGQAIIFLLYRNHLVVGGAFNLAYQGFYENGWFATLHRHQRAYASYVLHHAMIAHAVSLKCQTYSFGRSTTGGGVHRFKQQWGTTDIPLLWVRYPEQKISLRKQQWMLQAWKRMPWLIRKYLGGQIAKWIY